MKENCKIENGKRYIKKQNIDSNLKILKLLLYLSILFSISLKLSFLI